MGEKGLRFFTMAGDSVVSLSLYGTTHEFLDEYALLFGKRFVGRNMAFSFSFGASCNKWDLFYLDENFQEFSEKEIFPGIPFECAINWFKKKKAPYRIYGIIPVGKPTAFGNSFGLKVKGALSESYSFAGLGISLGIGYFKMY